MTLTAVAACMRNEGPFLIEWAAFHRAIGFDHVIICTNDCTDGSDTLLDRLDASGHVTHLRNQTDRRRAPQDTGMAVVLAHLAQTPITWLAHIDSDEFLNIGLGQGRVADILERAGGTDVIALPWLACGDSGHKARTLPILPNFTRSIGTPDINETKFKSMFRLGLFGHAGDHMPKFPRTDTPLVLAADGAMLDNDGLFAEKRAKYTPLHKAIRAEDDFRMKNDCGGGQGKTSTKYHFGSASDRQSERH